ncbi:MAG TPA: SDR family oxidoreductase [bacterium]|nr:SDR family oxidoreductase [bacterium]
MKVFVTGATGFVGSATVQELIRTGHQVLGLARSEEAVKSLTAAGAQVHRGSLQDLDSLKSGVAASDGVIHLGFIHDFTKFAENCAIDKLAIETMGAALAGSNKPIVVTSGTALVSPGTLALETVTPKPNPAWPRVSEYAADELAGKGINASVVRLSPSVHGDGDHGFVPMLISLAREKGVSAYIGEGKNRWTGVHRLDAGVLFRLALERGTTGTRYHGADEEGVAFKDIAEAIGKGLKLPVESKPAEHFGWFAGFAGVDCPASSKLTRESLGWKPTHKTLLADLAEGTYFKS